MDIDHGIRLATRHPGKSATIMARDLARRMGRAKWIDRAMKLRFCMLFVSNSLDGNIEKALDQAMLDQVARRPLEFGIRYLKRDRHTGLRVLVALVMRQLRAKDLLGPDEQAQFYDTLLERFFPGVKFIDDDAAAGDSGTP
jgi:hypothetical protein